jgi:hypothetical protein
MGTIKRKSILMRKITIRIIIFWIAGFAVYQFYFTKTTGENEMNSQSTNNIRIDTLVTENGFVIIGKNGNAFKLLHKKDSLQNENFHRIASFNDTVVLAKFKDLENTEIYKKITSNYSFEKYSVPIYKGELKDPDFKTNPEAKSFITRIKEGCKEGVNFAGHYTLIYWGCGTACQYGVVVDRKTGKIFNGYLSSLGSEFKADSKLIIFNAELENKKSKYIKLDEFSIVRIKTWEEKQFKNLY